jgi:hypothetical protein
MGKARERGRLGGEGARHGGGGSGGGQLVGGESEEAAAVSQDRRGGRKREALGGTGRLVEQRPGFGPFIHLDIDRNVGSSF